MLESGKLAACAAELPEAVAARIAGYADPQDRAVRMAGKRLLQKALTQHHGERFALTDLYYDDWGRPSLPGWKGAFSIAHTGQLAVCAFSPDGPPLGIDAEALKPLDLTDVNDYLTVAERAFIEQAPSRERAFYELWTRKEAVLKASGDGVGIPFAQVSALTSPVALHKKDWHWQPVLIDDDAYVVHLASARPLTGVQVLEVAILP